MNSAFFNDRHVGATRVMGVARFRAAGPIFFEVGVGAHYMSDASRPAGGASAALGYKIPLGPKMFIPLKLRADLVNDGSTAIGVISVSGGLSAAL